MAEDGRMDADRRGDPGPIRTRSTRARARGATEDPLQRIVWRRVGVAFGASVLAWVLHRLLGSEQLLGLWLTAAATLVGWSAAARMLLLDTALRRFWIIWLAISLLLLFVLGPESIAGELAAAFAAIFLIFRRYRPYRRLSSACRVRIFGLALIAAGLTSIGWELPPIEQPTWFHALGRNAVGYALIALRIFWLLTVVMIFARMRLHFLRLKPKMAVSALFIALVPLVLVLILGGLTVLGALGGSRAARGHALLRAWSEQVDHGMRLDPLPFARHFAVDLAGHSGGVVGSPPEWVEGFGARWLQQPAAVAADSSGAVSAGDASAVTAADDPAAQASPDAVPPSVRRGPISVEFTDEENLVRAWAPRDTTAYFRIGREVWLLRLSGRDAGAPRIEGYSVDSAALDYLSRVLHSAAGFYSTNEVLLTGSTGADDRAAANDSTRLRIDIRGSARAGLGGQAGGFWNEPIRVGGALLEALRPTDTGFTTDNIILYITASIHDLMQEFTLDEYRLNQVLVYGLLVLAVFFLIMEGFALFFGIRIATGITGAVAELTKGTLRLAEGDLDTHIEVPNEDELGDLAHAFNEMTGAVKRGREEAVVRERLERELETARAIQQRLLPRETPALPGFEITGTSVPSLQVGGDYFDFLDLGEDRLGVAIGDVSGKGMPAALLMANLQACLQGQVIHPSTVAQVVQRVNDLMVRSTDSQMFATFFYGVLDRATATFTSSNAGHNPPILHRAGGSTELLRRGGLLIGMLPGQAYEQETVVFEPGDLLVLYTDGITEAEGPPATPRGAVAEPAGGAEDEDPAAMFGEERLLEVVRRHAHRPVVEIRRAILAAVAEFTAGVPQSDDISLVLIRRPPGPARESR